MTLADGRVKRTWKRVLPQPLSSSLLLLLLLGSCLR
jgi:hypothetical protein